MNDMIPIHEIRNYLGTGLKISSEGKIWEFVGISRPYKTKDTVFVNLDLRELGKGHQTSRSGILTEDKKPLVRPLSDLTKEIEHNGERFVPLVRLLLISEGIYDTGDRKHEVMSTNSVLVHFGEFLSISFCLIKNMSDDVRIGEGLSFQQVNHSHVNRSMINECGSLESFLSKYSNITTCVPRHQSTLFQKLFEWNFDVYNWLGRNLALPITDK